MSNFILFFLIGIIIWFIGGVILWFWQFNKNKQSEDKQTRIMGANIWAIGWNVSFFYFESASSGLVKDF